ncbi:MAG: hypothetical protein M1148_02655 [Candidatus Thermoplasmatota archaeon]|nr:hypothetical protein [Candidatus Thermoplasmatota archaeon]
MRCIIEEKFKRLEKAWKHALEMAQEENQAAEESEKGKQDVSPGSGDSVHLLP